MAKNIINKISRLEIADILRDAIKEDLGAYGDITSVYIFSEEDFSESFIVCKEKGRAVLCGIDAARFIFEEIDIEVEFTKLKKDGDFLNCGDKICKIKGRTLSILESERISLNFIQHLSGIATATNKFASVTSGYGVKIIETRKTLPN